MRRRRLIELLVVRWGFAVMVAVAIATGIVAAATVAPPSDIPAVALRAVVVYRVEVGAAVFFGLYLATVALVLATHNRGFTEIGTGGLAAQDLVSASQNATSESAEMELVSEVMEEVRELRVRLEKDEDGL
jgi:hypothetical protein